MVLISGFTSPQNDIDIFASTQSGKLSSLLFLKRYVHPDELRHYHELAKAFLDPKFAKTEFRETQMSTYTNKAFVDVSEAAFVGLFTCKSEFSRVKISLEINVDLQTMSLKLSFPADDHLPRIRLLDDVDMHNLPVRENLPFFQFQWVKGY